MSEINKIPGSQFFANDNYDDNPMNFVPFNSIHEQKNAEYEPAFDGGEIDNKDAEIINVHNDYFVETYPQIATFVGEDDGVIIEGKGVVIEGSGSGSGSGGDVPYDEIWYTSSNGNIITPNSVAFGDGLTIVSNTYEDGKGIIKLSGNATTIGERAFYNCTSLTSIEIPDGVTSIGGSAFYDCTSLTSIEIPDSVTSIGNGVFEDCTSLTSITVNAITPPELGSLGLDNCSSSGSGSGSGSGSDYTIYIPAESVDTYKSASVWSDYACKIEAN